MLRRKKISICVVFSSFFFSSICSRSSVVSGGDDLYVYMCVLFISVAASLRRRELVGIFKHVFVVHTAVLHSYIQPKCSSLCSTHAQNVMCIWYRCICIDCSYLVCYTSVFKPNLICVDFLYVSLFRSACNMHVMHACEKSFFFFFRFFFDRQLIEFKLD